MSNGCFPEKEVRPGKHGVKNSQLGADVFGDEEFTVGRPGCAGSLGGSMTGRTEGREKGEGVFVRTKSRDDGHMEILIKEYAPAAATSCILEEA